MDLRKGANGGLAGSDVCVTSKTTSPRFVDVSGIDSHQVKDLPIVSVGGVVPSQAGPGRQDHSLFWAT